MTAFARAHLRAEAKDSSGNVKANRQFRVYEFGTTTDYTDTMYSARSGGVALTQPLTANVNGIVEAWTDYGRKVTLKDVTTAETFTGEFLPDPGTPQFATLALVGPHPYIDPTASPYGAVGDANGTLGSTSGTDDTAAFNAALVVQQAAGSPTYYEIQLPARSFNLRYLRLPPAGKLKGRGIGKTILKRIGSGVTAIRVTNGGSGYSSNPSIAINGGGGSGATASATVAGGVITRITLVTNGSGYTSDPTIVITDGTGINATADATCAFITEQDTSSGAQGIILEDLTIENNQLGTHGVSLGFSSPLAGAAMAVGSYLRNVWIDHCTNGDALKVNGNVTFLDHLWLQHSKRGLYADGSNITGTNINIESNSTDGLVLDAAYSTFAVQMEPGTGNTAQIWLTSFADHNVITGYIASSGALTGDVVRLDSGSAGNEIRLRTAMTGGISGYVVNDLNTPAHQITLTDLGSPADFIYCQPRRHVIFGGGVRGGLGGTQHIRQFYKTIVHDAGTGNPVQVHDLVNSPAGLAFITRSDGNAALFRCEGGSTTLVSGGAMWADGTSLGGAGKSTLYVTGAVLKLANQDNTTDYSYDIFMVCQAF